MPDDTIINKTKHFLEATEQYLVVIASCLAKKLDPKKEPILASIVKKYPYANVYETDTDGRPKPGSFVTVGDGLKRRYVIVVYSQIYPSKMDYPRDNKRKRLEWFVEALNGIAEIENLKSLAFPRQIARDGGGNWGDYYLAISDFAQTLALKCSIPISIYENPHADGKTTQISLINCLNLDTSIALDKLVLASNLEKIKVEQDELEFQPKKKKKLQINLEKLKANATQGRSFVVDDDDDNQGDNMPKIKFKKPQMAEAEPKNEEERLPDFPVTKLNPDWKTPLTEPQVDPSWDLIFQREEVQKKLAVTHKLLVSELQKHGDSKRFLPAFDSIFKTFQLCKWEDLRVCILGQDPYVNPAHAMGLAFSVPDGANIPKSLVNIFKEIKDEYGDEYEIPKHGNLEKWVRQGVLLLNSALTVREKDRNSHQNYWRNVTTMIIKLISELKEKPMVFILWGGDARRKANLINHKKHLILESNHPSPLSAYRGFFGNNHFKICNKKLTSCGSKPIDWQT